MNDLLARVLGEGEEMKERLGRIKKRRPFKAMPRGKLLLSAIIFALCIRLFFSIFLEYSNTWSDNSRDYFSKNADLADIDPLNRLERNFLKDKCRNSSSLCQTLFKREKPSMPEQEDYDLVQNYPIEEMLPAIKKLDQKTANYLIAIAKKESNWGKHAPSKNGQDCYNYWGYKGGGENQVLGYSCFSTREEAIEKVGARIEKLIKKGLDTPQKMLVWKCGSSCAGHDPQGVRKWVADVESVLKSIKS